MKVAVLGAAGLVGSVLVQRLRSRSGMEVRACVRNPATSWPLIRLGLEMVPADLRKPDQLARAVDGCTHVVNCALGEDRELVACMRNLVDACGRQGVRRLVHLSSVTAYGDPPGPDCETEAGMPRPQRSSYGWFKLKQDEIALNAHRRGLSTAVLCLPHVTGPNSRFLLSVIRELRERRFALIDGGRHPVVLADVSNVAQAIELAIHAKDVDGRRMFINDGAATTWSMVVDRLAPLANVERTSIPDLSEPQVLTARAAALPWGAALRQILALPEVRAILQRTAGGSSGPLATRARALVKRSSGSVGTPRPAGGASTASVVPAPGLWRQQLRKVPHSIDRARAAIGFEPEASFESSMDAFGRWFDAVHQRGSDYWELSRRL